MQNITLYLFKKGTLFSKVIGSILYIRQNNSGYFTSRGLFLAQGHNCASFFNTDSRYVHFTTLKKASGFLAIFA